MAWPTLIQLYDSQNSAAYNGSELRATWYVEPYDAIPAFVSSMLGRVDLNGATPIRTLPAQHFLYPWCLAVQCDDLPLDQRQLSYRGTTGLADPLQGGNRSQQRDRVVNAVQAHPSSTQDIDTAGFVSSTNSSFSAGGFVVVTYQSFLFARYGASGTISDSDMDFVNYRFEDRERKNIPNAGLKLITPENAINLFGAGGLLYPNAGISPEFAEQYLAFIVERRMLNPNFDLGTLASYLNCVDNNPRDNPARVPGNAQFGSETLRFAKYQTEYVQVPAVDDSGNVAGYSRWLNLTLMWDWRTAKSVLLFDSTGRTQGNKLITWNHVLAYPGTLTWLEGGGGTAWYYVKFSSQKIGVDVPAYPFVSTVTTGGNILDPLTINP